MALKSIKNKIANMTRGEVLGEADTEFQEPKAIPKQNVIKKQKDKFNNISKTSNEKQVKKPVNPSKKNSNNNNDELSIPSKLEKKASQVSMVNNNAIDGYEDVLAILGIKEELQIEVDFKSDDMDYVEFSQTTPLGFDFDEVTDFISRTKYTLHKLESALAQRNKDIVTIASEVKKVEQKMMEKNQERELDKMLGGMTEEERLIADNMDLKVEVNNLEREKSNLLRELDEARKDSVLVEQLREELAELKRTMSSGKANSLPSSLPIMSDDMDLSSADPFDDMIKEIGGLYDE